MVRDNYIARLAVHLWRLLQGLGVTMRNFLRPKVTEQYPENRGRHVYFERFRGELSLVRDQAGQHRCTACGICRMNCPNGTIRVVKGADAKLEEYTWDVGSCTFCALCTRSCPTGAIEFDNRFEHSVFTREKLVKKLWGR